MNDWKELANRKDKPKMVKTNVFGFEFRDIGDRLNYGIFHKDTGDLFLGWIRKSNIDGEK